MDIGRYSESKLSIVTARVIIPFENESVSVKYARGKKH